MRVCCPLASLAFGKGKKSRTAGADAHSTGIGEEEGGLHERGLLCGKMLTCDKKGSQGPMSIVLKEYVEVRSSSAL